MWVLLFMLMTALGRWGWGWGQAIWCRATGASTRAGQETEEVRRNVGKSLYCSLWGVGWRGDGAGHGDEAWDGLG